MQKAVVATAASAPGIHLSADSAAFIVEQVQMARWTFEHVLESAPSDIDAEVVRRRIVGLSTLLEQLVAGAAQQGVAFEVHPDAQLEAERLAALRAGPAH